MLQLQTVVQLFFSFIHGVNAYHHVIIIKNMVKARKQNNDLGTWDLG